MADVVGSMSIFVASIIQACQKGSNPPVCCLCNSSASQAAGHWLLLGCLAIDYDDTMSFKLAPASLSVPDYGTTGCRSGHDGMTAHP